MGEQGGGGDQTRGLSGLHVRQQEEEEAGERQSSGHGVVWCGVVWCGVVWCGLTDGQMICD